MNNIMVKLNVRIKDLQAEDVSHNVSEGDRVLGEWHYRLIRRLARTIATRWWPSELSVSKRHLRSRRVAVSPSNCEDVFA